LKWKGLPSTAADELGYLCFPNIATLYSLVNHKYHLEEGVYHRTGWVSRDLVTQSAFSLRSAPSQWTKLDVVTYFKIAVASTLPASPFLRIPISSFWSATAGNKTLPG
jgi:hypothetical protein